MVGVYFYEDMRMNKLWWAIIFGCAFALVDYLIMLPNTFVDEHQKFIATWSAVTQAFAIGFLIPFVDLPLPVIVRGGLVGLLISTPAAIIVGMYPQIIGNGLIGGLIIGTVMAVLC